MNLIDLVDVAEMANPVSLADPRYAIDTAGPADLVRHSHRSRLVGAVTAVGMACQGELRGDAGQS